ncbi:hypothetical protein NDU88_001342 [Pleurodeles waltl]|uniref:Uncharacterized protein n=1 Tax=Pleurodeles waltl TaxID=8319 RepID=A0AAV7THL1_PLEWA|nr:hypothetical protein NDU88_001342 [Pleurodeles waltl]
MLHQVPKGRRAPQRVEDQTTALKGISSHWSKHTSRQLHSSRGKCSTAATPTVVALDPQEVSRILPQPSASAKKVLRCLQQNDNGQQRFKTPSASYGPKKVPLCPTRPATIDFKASPRGAHLQAAERREAAARHKAQVQARAYSVTGAAARRDRRRPRKQRLLSPRSSGGAGGPLLNSRSSPWRSARAEPTRRQAAGFTDREKPGPARKSSVRGERL